MISRATEHRLVLLAGLLLAVLLYARPDIDLGVSRLFYVGDGHWRFTNDMLPTGLAYRWTTRLGWLLLAGIALLLAAERLRLANTGIARRSLLFLLVGALLGPVLLVDVGLKGHGGRARPASVAEFAGARHFTPAFVASDQCDWNCSFVSGHVATASFVMAFGWLGSRRSRRAWLAASLVLGAYVGWARIAVGAHFLSDALFAWFSVYLALWLSEKLICRSPDQPPSSAPLASDH